MTDVRLWLRVVHGGDSVWRTFGDRDRLLTVTIDMGFLPDPGPDECVQLWPGEGPHVGVYRRYWNFDGTAHLELPEIWVDPVGGAAAEIRAGWGASLGRGPRQMPWWTVADGDPLPDLMRCGWREYPGESVHA